MPRHKYGLARPRRVTVWQMVISNILIALIAAGGVYLWQASVSAAEIGKLQKEVSTLEKEVTDLKTAITVAKQPTPVDTEAAVKARGQEALSALKAGDMGSLAKMVHPDKGIRFSPYAYVNKETDKVFTAQQVANLFEDKTKYTWGSFDGSGEPIKFIFAEYYSKFVYDQDFLNAKEFGYNRRVGQGNSLDNSKEAYPQAAIVEYHFPGFDPKYNGMDWKSLRLVFEETDGLWYLVGIIHDQWTI